MPLKVFLLGVSLSGEAVSCGRFRSSGPSLVGAVMASSREDESPGVVGAAGRDSTNCEAEITGFVGAGGVMDV